MSTIGHLSDRGERLRSDNAHPEDRVGVAVGRRSQDQWLSMNSLLLSSAQNTSW